MSRTGRGVRGHAAQAANLGRQDPGRFGKPYLFICQGEVYRCPAPGDISGATTSPLPAEDAQKC